MTLHSEAYIFVNILFEEKYDYRDAQRTSSSTGMNIQSIFESGFSKI
jgi:hypothetical protein